MVLYLTHFGSSFNSGDGGEEERKKLHAGLSSKCTSWANLPSTLLKGHVICFRLAFALAPLKAFSPFSNDKSKAFCPLPEVFFFLSLISPTAWEAYQQEVDNTADTLAPIIADLYISNANQWPSSTSQAWITASVDLFRVFSPSFISRHGSHQWKGLLQ